MLALLSLMTSKLVAQEPTVTSLVTQDLANVPGKEVEMITVEYPPGGADPAAPTGPMKWRS